MRSHTYRPHSVATPWVSRLTDKGCITIASNYCFTIKRWNDTNRLRDLFLYFTNNVVQIFLLHCSILITLKTKMCLSDDKDPEADRENRKSCYSEGIWLQWLWFILCGDFNVFKNHREPLGDPITAQVYRFPPVSFLFFWTHESGCCEMPICQKSFVSSRSDCKCWQHIRCNISDTFASHATPLYAHAWLTSIRAVSDRKWSHSLHAENSDCGPARELAVLRSDFHHKMSLREMWNRKRLSLTEDERGQWYPQRRRNLTETESLKIWEGREGSSGSVRLLSSLLSRRSSLLLAVSGMNDKTLHLKL